jgi:hypothetical protein
MAMVGFSNFWGGCEKYQSTRDREILYAHISLKDEQLLIRPLLGKTKNTNMAGNWNVKLTFYFIEVAHEPLYLDKLSLVQRKIMDIPTSFIWTIIFVGGAFKYGGGSKFWGYVGKNAEPLCVVSCNFVHCHAFLNDVSYCH